jgi:NMD protein affecting ribosome stability and mRNA decay
MKSLSNYIKAEYPEKLEEYERLEAEAKKKLQSDLALSVGDLVRFRKKELSMVQIVGKILSIKEIDIREIKKYDTTSYSSSNKEDRDDQ